ncbi:MAG: hypothetical protein M8861_11455 [marine benthic group bacterium]|nr:hypothetical protein [Gemmatimonadota bacterium]
MAEMKISNGPLKLTLTDDKGRVVAALRYPRVKWKKLVIESEDAEFDAVVLSGTRVRLERRVSETERGPQASGGDEDRRPDWDPFREVEFGVRDFLTKTGKAVEDFLADLNEWSGPFSEAKDDPDPEAETK